MNFIRAQLLYLFKKYIVAFSSVHVFVCFPQVLKGFADVHIEYVELIHMGQSTDLGMLHAS